MDIVIVLATSLFFAIAVAYVALCDRLRGER